MKTLLPFVLMGCILAVLGCTPPQVPVQITTTRPVLTPLLETQTSLAVAGTETTLPVTPFSTPMLASPTAISLRMTETPVSTAESVPDPVDEVREESRATIIPTPTTVPLPTAPFEPFTQGAVLFLWNEALPPASDGPSEFEPTVNLYLAQPGATAQEWHIRPLLSNMRVLAPAYPSPDETKIALLILLEDSQTDGNGIYQIHVYSFADGSLRRIENQGNPYGLNWLPDSESIVFSQEKDVFIDRLDGSPPQPVTDNSDPSSNWFDGQIGQLAGSPNGRFQALNVYPDSLAVLNMESGETF